MLAHEVHGSGEPLVLVHGLTHRRQAWYPVLDQLAEQRQVILFDLPGHGQSPDLVVRDGDVQASLRVALQELFDEIDLESPHIAGNSLGGRIALEAAADGLVRSATTLSPAAFWWGAPDFVYVRAVFTWLTASANLLSPAVPRLARSPHARRVMGAMVSRRSDLIPHDVFVDDLRGMRRAIPAMKQIFPAAEPFAAAVPSDVPVTIAWGEHDRILLPYHAAIARRRMPQARHVVLRGCGHVPMADDPAQVAQVLLDGSAPVLAAQAG
jgi:pimeloyl-ACP methyl ester carboxylesterase